MRISRKLTLAILLQAVLVLGITQMSIFVGTSSNNISQLEDTQAIQQGQEIEGVTQQNQNEVFTNLNIEQDTDNVPTNFVFFIVSTSIVANIILVLIIIKILKKDSELKARHEKFTALGELAAKMAHDLRNPLFVLQSEIEMLTAKYNTESEDTRLISKSMSDIKYLINDILNFKKSQKLVKKLTSFKQIVSDSLQTIPIPDNITVKISDYDKMIYCDPIQLQRVIVNIIHNSVAAIGERPGKIQIQFLEKSKFIICRIEDSGPGITKKDEKNIFQPLFTTKPDGTGLGLYSSKTILEQHNGKLSFKNDPTTFDIYIPKSQIVEKMDKDHSKMESNLEINTNN